jgi:dsDNA-specific endonuclease/ATPase MutS2
MSKMTESMFGNNEEEVEFQMDFTKNLIRTKRAHSMTPGKHIVRKETQKYEENILKLLEDNLKLEEEMEKMKKYSEENEVLRRQLSTAKHKLSSHQKQAMEDKDKKIDELAATLGEREEKYKELLTELGRLKDKLGKEEKEDFEALLGEKEQELDRINNVNANYRAQLIELKISMSKTRDL